MIQAPTTSRWSRDARQYQPFLLNSPIQPSAEANNSHSPTMPTPSLLALPQELLIAIEEKSDYASSLALRYTCRQLFTTLATPSDKRYDISDLLKIEKWPCYDLAGMGEGQLKQPLATWDFFACSYCLKIRCASKFSNAMMKGKRGKHSLWASDGDERRHRFCIDCGVTRGRYIPGTQFEFGGARLSHDMVRAGRGIVCVECRKFKQMCWNSGIDRSKRTCEACLAAMRMRNNYGITTTRV
jgi:hypothetical protein